MGVIERQSSLRIRVVDQRSSTMGLIENEQGLQEKKIEKFSGRRGETPLHLAVNTGSLPKVEEILLDLKANGLMEKIWEENNEGQTALCVAAKNGNVEIVQEILKVARMQSADPDRSCDAFHVAAKLGHAGKPLTSSCHIMCSLEFYQFNNLEELLEYLSGKCW